MWINGLYLVFTPKPETFNWAQKKDRQLWVSFELQLISLLGSWYKWCGMQRLQGLPVPTYESIMTRCWNDTFGRFDSGWQNNGIGCQLISRIGSVVSPFSKYQFYKYRLKSAEYHRCKVFKCTAGADRQSLHTSCGQYSHFQYIYLM